MRRKRIHAVLGVVLLPALFLSGQTPTAEPQKAGPARIARVESYILWLPDASLVYEPSSKSLEITAMGTILSHGRGWGRRQARPYLYHLRHASWKRHFWQVNTRRREVRLIWDGPFGVKWAAGALTAREDDGTREDLAVDISGGDPDEAPGRFLIRFPNAQLFFVPSTGAFRLAAAGSTLSPCIDWQSFRLQDDLYQVRLATWKHFFWKVSTSRLEAWRTRGVEAVFGKPGGEDTALPVTMARSSVPFSLALLRTVLTAVERLKLHELAQMIITGKPVGEIIEFSKEFVRQYPDVDPESAVMDVSAEIERDPAVSKEIKDFEEKMKAFQDKRQEFQTAYESFDQKTNQLFTLLSTVLKNMKETQAVLTRKTL